jgi:hypothetical protein
VASRDTLPSLKPIQLTAIEHFQFSSTTVKSCRDYPLPPISLLSSPFSNYSTGEHLQPILSNSVKLDFPFPYTSKPARSCHSSQTATPSRPPSSIATALVLS